MFEYVWFLGKIFLIFLNIYFRVNKERWNIKEKFFYDIVLVKGFVYVILNRRFVEYVIINRVVVDFFEWVNKMGILDEIFFVILIYNF